MTSTVVPPKHVVRAFGVDGEPVALPGGQRPAWRYDDVVLKPLDTDVEVLEWLDGVLRDVDDSRIRLSWPVRSIPTGEFVVDGWTGWTYLSGISDRNRWAETSDAGYVFSEVFRNIPRPGFLTRRQDPWAVADRIAWGEIADLGGVEIVARVRQVLEPISQPNQLIHGDLTGNVLLAHGLAPGVIDLSLYWRPAQYGSAIVLADAMLLGSRGPDVMTKARVIPQLVLRALLFRTATDLLMGLHRSSQTEIMTIADEIAAAG